MKFSKVANICKKSKCIYLYNYITSTATQWLGNGSAMYRLDGMPYLTPDELLALWSIPEKNWLDYGRTEKDMPSNINFIDNAGIPIKKHSLSVGWKGESFQLFEDTTGIYAINEIYLAPFTDNLDYIEYHRQPNQGGGFLLGVAVGLGLQAVIAPSMIIRDSDFTEPPPPGRRWVRFCG